jgi:hypothetical protein
MACVRTIPTPAAPVFMRPRIPSFSAFQPAAHGNDAYLQHCRAFVLKCIE